MQKKLSIILLLLPIFLSAQEFTNYWQQHVDYAMNVDVDVENFQYSGTQKLVYTNNSPNTLHKVFYHLYFNAFQPGSEMDMRLQNVPDPDSRMVINIGTKTNPVYQSRISQLKPNEIGYLKVKNLTQNGKKIEAYKVEGTVLEVTLNEAILPGAKTTFQLNFEGQVPVMIRRAGRNNPDGVAFSMAQWYPKLAEYDAEGWHANPYIAREFHGVWGNFDVTININEDYTVAGSGVLQNAEEIGHGYAGISKKLKPKNGNKHQWHFIANKVHDFTWAADPNYKHDVLKTAIGVDIHFFYKNEEKYKKAWQEVQSYTAETLLYFHREIGPYLWPKYAVIQGGDGGMEYAMCTLIEGGKTRNEILGTILHEVAHAWFQQAVANNENMHSWLDEGFANFISTKAYNLFVKKSANSINTNFYNNYFYMVKNGLEEPLTTHADRFKTNIAFSMGSYTKGQMFLTQLQYIIGEENLNKSLRTYYNKFKMKHAKPMDFIRVAEEVSNMQLKWYLNEWIETTHTIDYAIASYNNKKITLARVGEMPMPIEVSVTYVDDTLEKFYIPLSLMRGEKQTGATILSDWSWGNPNYTFNVKKEVKNITLDHTGLMADIDRTNNVFTVTD